MCEQICLGDKRPGRDDDVKMVHISQKSLPVFSDEAMVLKSPDPILTVFNHSILYRSQTIKILLSLQTFAWIRENLDKHATDLGILSTMASSENTGRDF